MMSPRLSALLLVSALLMPASLPAQTSRPTNDWTVLIYGASDNNSEESFCPDMADLRDGLRGTPGLDVVCLVDRSPRYSASTKGFGEDFSDTRLYHLTKEAAVRLGGQPQFPALFSDARFEANTGDARTLRAYIRWAKARYPARRYALIFYSHGNGPMWCPDEESRDHLFTAELTEVLEARDSLDLVVFDVCNMAGVENAYQWRPGTGRFSIGTVVATPMAGFPFPWKHIFSRIRAGRAPEGQPRWYAPADLGASDFGRLVVAETAKRRAHEIEHGEHSDRLKEMIGREAMACLDLGRAAAVKSASDELARALGRVADKRDVLDDLQEADDGVTAIMRYDKHFVDAWELARRLAAGDVAGGVRKAAEKLRTAVDEMVVSSYGLSHYKRFGGFEAGRHGVYIVLPAVGSSVAQGWGDLLWLSPDPAPEGARAFGRYAWCRDGATPGNGKVENWFELLDACYDSSTDKGGVNGYRW